MHAYIPNPKFMVMAEMSIFAIFCGRNVLGPNIQAKMSVAKMLVAEMCSAEMSEHRTFMAELLLGYCAMLLLREMDSWQLLTLTQIFSGGKAKDN